MATSRDLFRQKLNELVTRFDAQAGSMRRSGYDEATLRLEYLDPMFSALGWNVWNHPPQPRHMREVVVENRTDIRGRPGRVDYLFRTHGLERWICEAKKPFDNINRHFFQIQNYTYSMRLWLGVLCDFEHFIVFVVGGRPSKDQPFSPPSGWRLHYTDYESAGGKIWDLLSKDAVQNGSIEHFIQSLGKVSTKARQGWLIKPDRNKAADAVFLKLLENERRRFAKELVKNNPEYPWTGALLADALQGIFDRLLFQRVSEDRNIDVGTPLVKILDRWESRGKIKGQLWTMLAANFKHLAATFNGGVFGHPKMPPISDALNVPDRLLADFIEEIAGDTSEWLFGTMPLWLLGSVYERFLGSEIDDKGNVQEKAQARKSGGVYYTPEAVVRSVVGLTLDPLLAGKDPEAVLRIKVIDPSCGSGSFLLTVYSRLLQHCLDWYSEHSQDRKPTHVFEFAGQLWLTTAFKRIVLRSCIFGIDIDPVAVRVARMSLCLRVLEDETQEALTKEMILFPKETFLPDLDDNIIHANSLIPITAYPNFIDEEYLNSCNAVDLGALRSKTFRKQGFDVVVGNPPWGADMDIPTACYLRQNHSDVIVRMPDTYIYFTHLAINTLLRRGGVAGLVLPGTLLNQSDASALRRYLLANGVEAVADLGQGIFQGALNTSCIVVCRKGGSASDQVEINDVKEIDLSIRETMVGNWTGVSRERWRKAVEGDPAATFFTSNLNAVDDLSRARREHGSLGDLIDDFSIQRGVTPDVAEAHVITLKEAQNARLEKEVLRNSLRGEDIKPFVPALPTRRIIYTTKNTNSIDIPNTIKHLRKFKKEITCKEVSSGRHPWWRLHRPRDPAIFDRPKIIGLTTSRKVELVWDRENKLVVTDAMYVFAPKQNIPTEYILGMMQSYVFLYLYRLCNQGDARVIPQIKAVKLLEVPMPRWNKENSKHAEVVSLVRSLLRLAGSETPGAARTFAAQRRALDEIAAEIFGINVIADEV